MSRRNGDRARFQKDRKRKMLRRQRIQVLATAVKEKAATAVAVASDKPFDADAPTMMAARPPAG